MATIKQKELAICKSCGGEIKNTPYASRLRKHNICYFCISDDSYEDLIGKPKIPVNKKHKQRCIGATKKGVQCKVYTRHPSGFCKHHRSQIVSQEKIKPIERQDYVIGKKTEYEEYLASSEWKARRLLIISQHHGQCAICGEPSANVVHHNSYKRRGKENIQDLVLLCEACHNFVHKHYEYDGKAHRHKLRNGGEGVK